MATTEVKKEEAATGEGKTFTALEIELQAKILLSLSDRHQQEYKHLLERIKGKITVEELLNSVKRLEEYSKTYTDAYFRWQKNAESSGLTPEQKASLDLSIHECSESYMRFDELLRLKIRANSKSKINDLIKYPYG